MPIVLSDSPHWTGRKGLLSTSQPQPGVSSPFSGPDGEAEARRGEAACLGTRSRVSPPVFPAPAPRLLRVGTGSGPLEQLGQNLKNLQSTSSQLNPQCVPSEEVKFQEQN